METDRGVLIVGGPDMGKTNYLARLWGAVYKSETGILSYDGLPDDLEHLNTILGSLLAGNFAERTKHDEHWHCEIPLKVEGDGAYRGKLIVPDCPGEEWQRIYKNNEWSEVWENLIDGVRGCLCFLRPNSSELRAPLDWMTCWKHFGTGNVEMPLADETPTQVEMVHWIQCLRYAQRARRSGAGKLRIGVVVSAWDALPGNIRKGKPTKYLEENVPLLHQFMGTNTHAFEFAAFGVSIAGGDLKKDEDFKKEYQQGDPFSAGYVIHELGGRREESPDHTLPVAWAMGLDPVLSTSQGGGT
jgi:hypothetical protein